MASDEQDVEVAAQLFEREQYAEAAKRYLSAAKQGSLVAQTMVGWMYEVGRGVTRDIEEAKRWYAIAANAGHANAQFYLGQLHRSRSDYGAALEWLEKAAAQRYAPALYRLGRMYDVGAGVQRDRAKATANLTEAARLGHLFARREVAVRMIKGKQGFGGRLRGILLFCGLVIPAIKIGWKEPDSELILR